MAYVWAHRGASGYAPENTMEAFRLAQEMGADGIELDVHLSKDGEMIVTHDENLRRVTGGVDALVGDMTLAQIEQLHACNGMEAYRGAKIPTLDQVLDFLQTNDMYLNIEIKTGVVIYDGLEEKVVAAVQARGLSHRVIYSSFNHYSLMLVRKSDPDANIGLLYSEAMVDPYVYALHLGANAIHPHMRTLLVPGTVENCTKNGILTNPWTVDDPGDMQWLIDLGCNAIISNLPDVARKIVDANA